jgi:hypothetical protein
MSQMIMPSDDERETLLVGVVEVQLLRERLIRRTGSAVGRASGTARRQRAETIEAAGAAVLRHTLRKAWRSSEAARLLLLLLLLLLRQLLVGARRFCQRKSNRK